MHLIRSLSISYPYLIKFHDFAENSQQGMLDEASNEGCNSGQQGMTLWITYSKGRLDEMKLSIHPSRHPNVLWLLKPILLGLELYK